VRPSVIMMLTGAVVLALGGAVLGLGVFVDHTGGKFWFYWIAPLLALGTAGLFAALAVGYWMKVGRLESKGRPRSD
jgi:hypothetical protein